MNTKPNSGFVDLLKRPEVITLIAALIMQVLVYFDLPARAGIPVPEQALTLVVGSFWAVFIGAVFEGRFKGADYAGGLGQVVGGLKFRGALINMGVALLAGLLGVWQVQIPEETLVSFMTWVIYLILGKGAVDGAAVAFGRQLLR